MSPERYRQFLRTQGLTQAEFAGLLGHSPRTGQYWATESVPPSVETWVLYIEARPEALDVLRAMPVDRVGGEAAKAKG